MTCLPSQKIRQSFMRFPSDNPLPDLVIIFCRCDLVPQVNRWVEQSILKPHKDSPLVIVVAQCPIGDLFYNLSKHDVTKIRVAPFASNRICWLHVVQICHDLLDDWGQRTRIVVQKPGTMKQQMCYGCVVLTTVSILRNVFCDVIV